MKLMFNLDKKRKESILIIVLITFLLFATISLIILNINLPKKTVKENPSNHNQINTAQTENSIPNPLIDKAEIERVEKYYNTGDNEDQKPVKTNIQYQFELSPDLKKKKTALPYAYAASTCNIDTAPSDISAYILKAHWTTFEALKVANTFGISSEPSALPVDDSTFMYYFSNPVTNGFLSLYESSGQYTYHRVLTSQTGDIGINGAKAKAEEQLTTLELANNIKYISSNETNNLYSFLYKKDWGNFPLVDTPLLKTLRSKSVCDISDTENQNTIEILITKNGQLSKIINKIRREEKNIFFHRESLEEAINEYSKAPPIPPIILGTGPSTGKVIISEAQIVWYDYGSSYPQKTYIPMYLTSGTIEGTNTRVLTLFPAVTMKDLIASAIIGSVSQSLKLGAFIPKPPKPKYVGGCPGNLVDYSVSCSVDGSQICSSAFSIPSDKDVNDICQNGSDSWEGTIDTTPNENACKSFLEMNYDKFPDNAVPPVTFGTINNPGGIAKCVINGSPC